jgi:hypothetical protein
MMIARGCAGRVLAFLAISTVTGGSPSRAEHPQALLTEQSSDESPYDANREHLWNRLFRHFHLRNAPDGTAYYLEQMENAIFNGPSFSLASVAGQDGIALLDEFLRTDAERLVRDPIKRALFQRDAWGMFVATKQPEVQRRLAGIIKRVSLKAEEIERLPDNLAVALSRKAIPSTFDPAHPERPFLPQDLLDPSGPWVPFTRRDRESQPAALAHVMFTSGRGVFLPLLRLPGGREATTAYLKNMEVGHVHQFELGTQTALLRRVVLIDDRGVPRMSRLTESLHIRVFDSLEEEDIGRSFKYLLRRSSLLSEQNEGLHPVGPQDRSHFELGTCHACHARLERGGVASLQTLRTGEDDHGAGPFMRVGKLAPGQATDLDSQARYSLDWLEKSPAWKILKRFWQE